MGREQLQRVGEQLLPAVAGGDAAGLPVEAKNTAWIQKHYGWLDHSVAPTENPFYVGEWPVGTTSDDTQLTVAVTEGLLAAGGFDIAAQARAHIEAYHAATTVEEGQKVTRAWGGSTTRSVERLLEGISPEVSGEKNGVGNGVLMKLAPLVYWQTARDTTYPARRREYDALTTMTHDDDIARACTRLHGETLRWLLLNPGASLVLFRQFALGALDDARQADPDFLIHQALIAPSDSFQALVKRYTKGKNGFQYGFYAPETLAMTYDIFQAAGGDYETAIWYAANLGGDADSTASIVGAMCHFASGGEYKRSADFENIAEYDRLTRLSSALARQALKLVD